MAFDNLVSLLDDQEEITTVHAEFCAIDDSANELSSAVLELIMNDMEVRSTSRADYSINCWDTTWLGVVAELTAIRNALRKEDTLGLLLYEHFSTHPEVLDSIHEIEKLLDLDWLTLEPKKVHRKKRQNKQWVNERAYDDML